MYHRIIILALLFFPFPGKTISLIFDNSLMEISNALPVQFYLVGCDTYNEHINAGVHHKCYCAPWQCDDEIKIQIKNTAGLSMSLLVIDENSQELLSIQFDETSDGVYLASFIPENESPSICDEKIALQIKQNAQQEAVPIVMPALTDYLTTEGTPPTLAALSAWVNATGSNPGTWTLDADPDVSVNGNGGVSGYIAGAIATNAGFDYEFDVQFEIFGAGAGIDIDVTFALLDASFNEIDTALFNYTSIGVKTPNFTLNGSVDGTYLAMRITNDTPIDTKTFIIQSASYTPGVTTYEWTLGATPNVTLPGSGLDPKSSELLYADATFVVGNEYTVTATYTRVVNSGTDNPRSSELFILNSSNVTQFSQSHADSAGSNTVSVTFTATASTTRVGFSHDSGSDVTITITDIEGSEIQTTGQDAILAKSDCLDVQTEHEESILLTYSNHKNFAGLVYEDASPTIEFFIRVPCVFVHQRFPEEDEVMELSTSLVTLNGTVRKQRLLDTDYLPYYFHEKMKLILKHQILEIFTRQWVKQESYEIVEGDRRWPMKKAKCWLSEKDFVHRNIL